MQNVDSVQFSQNGIISVVKVCPLVAELKLKM